MTYLADRASDRADATVTLERAVLNRLDPARDDVRGRGAAGLVDVEGDAARVAELFGLLDDFSPMFEIVEPKRER